jgi:nitrogen fixation protein FixH
VWLVVVSQTSWTGMVVTDPYIAGQLFEGNRKAHDAQIAAGWTSKLDYADGLLKLVVLDRAGNPVNLGKVSVKINRPVGGHDDTSVALEPSSGGYEVALTLNDGPWEASASALATPLGPFQIVHRFTVNGGGK